MGILRVKRDSPYLYKNNDVKKNTVVLWCVTQMRKMWVRRTAER